jgi:hypothetical protein
MSEKQDNLRRKSGLTNNWNQRRFEQEVAEEINLGRQKDRDQNHNQKQGNTQHGRGGAGATFTGPKSSHETSNQDRSMKTAGTNKPGDRRC